MQNYGGKDLYDDGYTCDTDKYNFGLSTGTRDAAGNFSYKLPKTDNSRVAHQAARFSKWLGYEDMPSSYFRT